jgi:YD repeat-containing protein
VKKLFLTLFVLLTTVIDVAGVSNILETFTYDSQRRLTNYTRNGQTTVSVAYSPMGNITSKTDAGTLEYNVQGKPYAIGTQTGNPGSVPERVQDITYTGFQRPSTIEENSYKATFTYVPKLILPGLINTLWLNRNQ